MNSDLIQVRQLMAAASLLQNISDTPQLDCQLLLSHSLNRTREWLIAHDDDFVCSHQAGSFQRLIERRLAGEPIAYIVGYKDFWDSRFSVTPDTLIPRPETELLVETILDTFDNSHLVLADFGTGSGAIAVSLAQARPGWQVIGLDLSLDALKIAKKNELGGEGIGWIQGNWGSSICDHSLDILVSNPPYIAEEDDHLRSLRYEPKEALVAADSGFADLKQIITQASRLLKPGGTLALEHGYDQQEQVCRQLRASDFVPRPLYDIQGNARAVMAIQSESKASNKAET